MAETYSTEPNPATQSGINDKRQLNVIFHGLWAWESQADKILAHTPKEAEHKILAGNFSQQTELAEGEMYTLGGVDAGDKNAFREDQNVMVHNKPFADETERYCVVTLPLAREIHSLRRVPVGNEQAFGGDDGAQLDPKEVTMVQVLVYDTDDLAGVTLGPSNVAVEANTGGKTGNLHLFAQPPGGHHHAGHHANNDVFVEAYKRMARMFDLDIVPLQAFFTGVPRGIPAIAGLTPQDLLLLGESSSTVSSASGASGSGGFGGPTTLQFISGSNCDGLVVDNREISGTYSSAE